MVLDAVRGYWSLASGLTDLTRQKATAAAKALVSQGEATAEQVGAIAEELISTSASNRAALVNIIRFEVDRARLAFGIVTGDDIDELRERVQALEAAVRELSKSSPQGLAPPTQTPAIAATPAKKAPATPAKKTAPTKATPPRSAAKKSRATKAVAKEAEPAKAEPAKAVAKKAEPAKAEPAKAEPAPKLATAQATRAAATAPAAEVGP